MKVKVKSRMLSKDKSLEVIITKCKKSFNFPSQSKESKKFFNKFNFHYEECWNLDKTIVAFILPRLVYFRSIQTGTPNGYFQYDKNFNIINEEEGHQKWLNTLDLMIEGFYRYLFVDELLLDSDREKEINRKYINKGFNLFIKNFGALWD